MAIHCSVCGTRLFGAVENFGSFACTFDFKGINAEKFPVITDTCQECAKVLMRAVTNVANKIVEQNQEKVNKVKQEILDQKLREEETKKAEDAFIIEWEKKKNNAS